MTDSTFLAEHFINRELSWLDFNARVLEEAQDERNPLIERVKFLAIFASNLDEFFMVRVAGLREQAFGALPPQDTPADGMNSLTQLQHIAFRTRQLVSQQYECWNKSILPALAKQGVEFVSEKDLSPDEVKHIDKFFRQRVFPVLTPMAIDPSHPSPRFHNRGLYLAATLRRQQGIGPSELFAVVQAPQNLPRVVPVDPDHPSKFVLLEEVIASRLTNLFGGYDLIECGAFRVTRDMDIDLLDEEGDDLLRAIESRIRARQRSEAVRLEVSSQLANSLLKRICTEEEIRRGNNVDDANEYNEVYTVNGPLDMTGLMELRDLINRPDLCDTPFRPRTFPLLAEGRDPFAVIAEGDVLLHHPYDSFQPVVEFVRYAARDPKVLAIKQTLYRTSGDSPIVDALIDAAEDGKHVTALVELKARFDEANNISWARRMERAGVHVVFGFMDLKTHCKLALVVRQEGKKVRRYAHLSTGNYNPTTARLYTDMGLFTSDKTMTADVADLFNFLTGYSQNHEWNRLVIAPTDLHNRTIELIDEQAVLARLGKPSRIFAKLNSLVDRKTIEALYRASQAGVPIDLIIRGICCLRPGAKGISENIRVRSIVDRFLEHSRIMVFGEGDDQQVYLSSADWMPRNFERRVEVMFPVEAPEVRQRIVEQIIPIYLDDNQRARELQADATYVRVQPKSSEVVHRSQQELMNLALGRTRIVEEPPAPPKAKLTASRNGLRKKQGANKAEAKSGQKSKLADKSKAAEKAKPAKDKS